MSLLSPSERARLLREVQTLNGPAYFYVRDRMRRRAAELRAAFPPAVEICYSLKANPHLEVARALNSLSADVSSAGELARALDAGFAPNKISFVGPGKTERELSEAVERGCGLIVLESVNEALRLDSLCHSRGRAQDVLLRVNPHVFMTASGREARDLPSQFGLDEERLPEFFAQRFKRLSVRGLHVFTQSHVLDPAILARNFTAAVTLMERVRTEFDSSLDTLDLGGGFGLAYFAGQSDLDLEALREACGPLFARPWRLMVESGRFLVGESGFYVARVVDRKLSRGRTYLVLEGGLNHHLAATGFGQAIRRNFPVGLLKEPSGASAKETVTLVGPTCYAMDTMAVDVELPPTEIGDWLYFAKSGAYGATFSPIHFLSHPPPQEICL